MAVLEWRDNYRTGNPAVDHEHKELIELLNRLYERMAGGPPEDETLRDLGEVYATISAHFALEETVMREQLYDDYQAHKDDHEILLDEIRDIMDAYEAGVFIDQKDEFGARLRAWFGNHFSSKDARLHRVLGPAA